MVEHGPICLPVLSCRFQVVRATTPGAPFWKYASTFCLPDTYRW